MEELDKKLLLHILMCEIEEFSKCDYLNHVDEMATKIYNHTSEALTFKNDPKYDTYLRWAIKEYSTNHDEKAKFFQTEYIKDLKPFDKTSEIRKKFEEITIAYKPYWDNVLKGYIQKHAAIKRRKYLVEKTEEMANECLKCGFNDLAEIFNNYHNEQLNILSKVTQI